LVSELFFLAMSKVKIFRCNETVEILKASRGVISSKKSQFWRIPVEQERYLATEMARCVYSLVCPSQSPSWGKKAKIQICCKFEGGIGQFPWSHFWIFSFDFLSFLLKSGEEIVWDDTLFLIQVTSFPVLLSYKHCCLLSKHVSQNLILLDWRTNASLGSQGISTLSENLCQNPLSCQNILTRKVIGLAIFILKTFIPRLLDFWEHILLKWSKWSTSLPLRVYFLFFHPRGTILAKGIVPSPLGSSKDITPSPLESWKGIIPCPLGSSSSCHKFFSSNQGRKIGSVVGYSTFAFRLIVPSSFLKG